VSDNATGWTVESAFAEFLVHFDELSKLDAQANEAETRLKIIDTILIEVLDWSKNDFEVETYCREVGFADYVFNLFNTVTLVLEAKRIGTAFTIPSAKFKAEPVCFALLEVECKESGVALRQALGYAASLGSRCIAMLLVTSQNLDGPCCQSGSCDKTVTVNGICYLGPEVNYVLFGKIFSILNMSESEMESAVIYQKVWHKYPYDHQLRGALSWAIAGYVGWPNSEAPYSDTRNCNPCSYVYPDSKFWWRDGPLVKQPSN
jgi:hypothetical protein